MKQAQHLTPSLAEIRRRLIGISDGLIQAVERGETSATIAAAVRASPEWTQYQSDYAESLTYPPLDVTESAQLPMPAYLRDLIDRRVAAYALAYERIPVPGQIVRVERLVTPRPDQLDAVLMAPIHVLLVAPAEAEDIWHGWLVSGETDYAGWWDFVLQEQDLPFDPEASMVQLWNPVRLYLPQAARVVGRLSLARLQAVRSLASDFATSAPPPDVASWPGRVANRTTNGGLAVVTGSPLGGRHDLRHQYQEIYFEAAEAVREPARLALRELAQNPMPILDLWSSITNRIGQALSWIAPEPSPQITYAALSGDRSFRFRFDGLLELEGTLDVKICAEDNAIELIPDIHGDPTGWFLVIADVKTGMNLLASEGNPAIALAKYYPGPISIPSMLNVDDIDARMAKLTHEE